MADELDVLLEKVEDPGLRAELRAAVDKVRAKRNFGLVFESHLPERLRLPEYPVRRGTNVVRRADSGPMKVEGVRRGQATVVTGVVGPATGSWTGRNVRRRSDRRWATAWSPEQISNRLRVNFPDDVSMRISHEAIYQALYIQGRGALNASSLPACGLVELCGCPGHGRSARHGRTSRPR